MQDVFALLAQNTFGTETYLLPVALHTESDPGNWMDMTARYANFYPRSPYGERH